MPPSDALVTAANAALADPNVRESVKQMHAEGYPLVQMVEALGLDDEMSGRIREIVGALAPDVVDGIRQATLAMLASSGNDLPLDCQLTTAQLADPKVGVEVAVAPEKGTPTIRVRSTSG